MIELEVPSSSRCYHHEHVPSDASACTPPDSRNLSFILTRHSNVQPRTLPRNSDLKMRVFSSQHSNLQTRRQSTGRINRTEYPHTPVLHAQGRKEILKSTSAFRGDVLLYSDLHMQKTALERQIRHQPCAPRAIRPGQPVTMSASWKRCAQEREFR